MGSNKKYKYNGGPSGPPFLYISGKEVMAEMEVIAAARGRKWLIWGLRVPGGLGYYYDLVVICLLSTAGSTGQTIYYQGVIEG